MHSEAGKGEHGSHPRPTSAKEAEPSPQCRTLSQLKGTALHLQNPRSLSVSRVVKKHSASRVVKNHKAPASRSQLSLRWLKPEWEDRMLIAEGGRASSLLWGRDLNADIKKAPRSSNGVPFALGLCFRLLADEEVVGAIFLRWRRVDLAQNRLPEQVRC